ncbi:hypothetical protein GG681_11005 [Epibacterium sp. SM1969]|uniref:Uncharacterized protein n=1 Tax=Tritonibacter aquimaris TaxID=2663379 RepID=A0A844AMH0_9RHOB|nr:hypothetical protein [Tritonibacter aquimaris]MQY43169.1 hypothetical protein [Tritonibacter aquimaris]
MCYPFFMGQQEFLNYLRQLEDSGNFSKTINRIYTNHRGIGELIMLPQCYWDIVDWLEQKGDISFADWVTHCSVNPHEDWSLSHQLMYWIWFDLSNRHRDGLETPAGIVPEAHLLATLPVNDLAPKH